MGTYKQLPSAVKAEIINAHKAGEGYKKLAKRFQLAASSVRNVIKKWQLTGMVDAQMRPGRPRKLSETTAGKVAGEANQKPCFDIKDLQEDLTDLVNTPTLQTISQPSTVMGNYKQLPSALKEEIIEGHKAGEGYKKLAKRFQVAASSVRNVIKKWQLTGMVVKFRPGRPRKLSDRTAGKIVRKANQNSRLTVKDFQEALRDPRTTGLKKKCVNLTKQIMDKIYITEDQDTLEKLSEKLSTLLEDLTSPPSDDNGLPFQPHCHIGRLKD
ncbi:hypothetical protein AALO_G00159320 [Alosa alosa]|uniref:Transposase n=1 Tax=Alosa alosa TaxID=278164 RepID=A0AAV6GFX3_9TELE|nr:hypothetical protein AALO_G00159320 [Alosa alosa]